MRLTSYRPAPSRVKALSDPLQCTCWQVRSRRSVVRVLRLVILSVLLSLCSPAWASPTAQVVASWDGACGPTAGQITLVVREGHQVLASLTTCSSYGRGAAQAVTGASGRTFILLHWLDGSGTNAWTDYLTVYRLDNDALIECNRTLVGEGVGTFARWRYSASPQPSPGGGIRIVLTLHVDMSEGDTLFMPELVPRERRRVIDIGANCAAAVS